MGVLSAVIDGMVETMRGLGIAFAVGLGVVRLMVPGFNRYAGPAVRLVLATAAVSVIVDEWVNSGNEDQFGLIELGLSGLGGYAVVEWGLL